jgi:hypothetical protein
MASGYAPAACGTPLAREGGPVTRPAILLEPGSYAVVRGGVPLPPDAPADGALRADLAAAGERSAVLPEAEVPPEAVAERGWRWLRVEGSFPFDAVGVIAPIAGALAARGVSIFVLSTWETDHVLVKEPSLAHALAALRAAGYPVRE